MPEQCRRPAADAPRSWQGDGSLHILATSTPQTCKMMACFLVWMRRMMLYDTTVDHQLHLKTYTPPNGTSGAGEFLSASYNSATASKAALIGGFLRTVPDGTVVVFTDLDIVPFEPYSELPGHVPPERELTFMYNNIPHEPVNTGFMMIRNSERVRDFMDRWKAQMEAVLRSVDDDYKKIRPPFDQKMANLVIRRLPKSNRSVRWGVFDNHLVTGLPDFVGKCTFAYHAISVGNHSGKMGRIDGAFARKRSRVGGRLSWQRECTPAEQDSCDPPPPDAAT